MLEPYEVTFFLIDTKLLRTKAHYTGKNKILKKKNQVFEVQKYEKQKLEISVWVNEW